MHSTHRAVFGKELLALSGNMSTQNDYSTPVQYKPAGGVRCMILLCLL